MRRQEDQAAIGDRRPTNLFLVTDSLQGGLGLAVLAQAGYFSRLGWSVVVAAPDLPASPATVEIVALPVPRSAFHVLSVLRTAHALRRILQAANPRVVHAHGLRSQLLVLLAGRRPYVSIHGGGRITGQSALAAAVRALCRRFAPLLARAAFSVAPMPGRWTLTLVASPRLAHLEQCPFSRAAEIPTFLWIGRLDSPKRPDLFVHAVAKAARSTPVRGVVIGDGPLFSSVESLVRSLDAPVELRGASEDISSALQEAWALCLFSESEGLPFVVQEAAWAARALVLSPLPRLRWFLGDAAAYAGTIDEASAALLRLTDRTHAEARGAAAAAHVRSRLRADSPGPDLARVYDAHADVLPRG